MGVLISLHPCQDVSLFYSSHPSRGEVVSYCSFDFISLMTNTMLSIFSYCCWPSVYINGEYIHILYPFLIVLAFLLLRCKNCSHILDTSTISDMWFANISCYSAGCLFILSWWSFEVQIFLLLMKVNLPIFLLLLMFLIYLNRCLIQGHKGLHLFFIL